MWDECLSLCGSLSILWHCLSLGLEWKVIFSSPVFTAEFSKNCWHIECSTFAASSFRIWNSSTGIPSPPLALFVVMLPKAHLTSHSKMSGSRWVITPSWLSGSWYMYILYSVMFNSLWPSWTVAHQAFLSLGFSRQEYWSWLPFPLQGIFPTQGLNLCLLHWQVDSLMRTTREASVILLFSC